MPKFLRSVLSKLGNPSDRCDTEHDPQIDDRAPNQVLAAVAYNEILIAIGATQVIWRPSCAGDETAGPIVRVPTLGSWTWSTRKDAKARVAAKYPELDEKTCARAVKLIESQIGKQNLREFRRGTTMDSLDRAYEKIMRGYNV